jgi:hypothetical protein
VTILREATCHGNNSTVRKLFEKRSHIFCEQVINKEQPSSRIWETKNLRGRRITWGTRGAIFGFFTAPTPSLDSERSI